MTQIESARSGRVTPEIEAVARAERLEPDLVRQEVARGRMVIPANQSHLARGLAPIGIGIAARTKINANIGKSAVSSDSECELAKLMAAVRYGADTVMDLSTGPEIDAVRGRIIEAAAVPVGTVPIYQVAQQLDDILDMRPRDFLDVVAQQARQGVNYMTIHAAVLREHLPLCERRLTGIVSRGGVAGGQVDDRPRPGEPLLHAFRRTVRHHARAGRNLEPGRRAAARLDRRRQR